MHCFICFELFTCFQIEDCIPGKLSKEYVVWDWIILGSFLHLSVNTTDRSYIDSNLNQIFPFLLSMAPPSLCPSHGGYQYSLSITTVATTTTSAVTAGVIITTIAAIITIITATISTAIATALQLLYWWWLQSLLLLLQLVLLLH